MLEKQLFYGVYTALVTPMTEDGSTDWVTLEKHVEAQIASGVDGLVPMGTTGESPTHNAEEHIKVIREVVRIANGRTFVIAGAGANSTREALHLTKMSEEAGADAFLQVAPYYNKPSQEGVFQHLKKIAESTGKPIMLYSIPGRCGIDIAVDTVKRLAEECPNIRTIKEAGGDAGRVRALLQACPELTVLSGDDGLIPAFVEAGAKGVVSVASNFAPEIIKTITTACLEGNTKESADLVEKWKPLLTDLVFMDGNPVTIKEVMYQAGRLPSPRVRLPLVRTGTENQTRIRELLQSINLLSA